MWLGHSDTIVGRILKKIKMSHDGPQYVVIKSLMESNLSSYSTELKLQGYAASTGFSWIDGLKKLHFVKVSSAEPEVTVVFPVSDCIVVFEGNNIGHGGTCNLVRTACGPHHKWCKATFSYKKTDVKWQGYVSAKLQFYTEQKPKYANIAA